MLFSLFIYICKLFYFRIIILTLILFSVFMQQLSQLYFLIYSSLLQFSSPEMIINNKSVLKEDSVLVWKISCWDSTCVVTYG